MTCFYFPSATEPLRGSRRLPGRLAVFRHPGGDETKLRWDETIFVPGEDIRKLALDIN
jgi:hypothetical protein